MSIRSNSIPVKTISTFDNDLEKLTTYSLEQRVSECQKVSKGDMEYSFKLKELDGSSINLNISKSATNPCTSHCKIKAENYTGAFLNQVSSSTSFSFGSSSSTKINNPLKAQKAYTVISSSSPKISSSPKMPYDLDNYYKQTETSIVLLALDVLKNYLTASEEEKRSLLMTYSNLKRRMNTFLTNTMERVDKDLNLEMIYFKNLKHKNAEEEVRLEKKRFKTEK